MQSPPGSGRREIELISGLASEDEQRRRVQRLRMGMKGQVEKHGRHHYGSIPPFGYLVNDEGLLAPDPTEARWVQWIYAQRIEGHSAGKIAADLTRLGVPTAAANPSRPSRTAGTFWHRATVTGILANPTYYGRATWGPYTNDDGAHTPLIARDLFERVQAMAGERHRRPLAQHDGWLRGRVRCGYCLHAMAHTRRGTRHFLRCGYHQSSHGTACVHNGHPMAAVQDFVQSQIIAILQDENLWREARAQQSALPDLAHQAADLQRAIQRNRTAHQRAYDAYVAGASDVDELKRTRATLDDDHAALQRRLAELTGSLHSAETALTQYQDLAAVADEFAHLPPDGKRRILHLLTTAVYLRRGQAPVIVWA